MVAQLRQQMAQLSQRDVACAAATYPTPELGEGWGEGPDAAEFSGPVIGAGNSSASTLHLVRGAANPLPADPTQPSKLLPAPQVLADIFPARGLPLGGIIAFAGGAGSTTLLLSLLTAVPGWSALVGMPRLGLLAATELGVDLSRVVIVPEPGPDLGQVLGILADGVDLLAVSACVDDISPGRMQLLRARLRQHGAVLLVTGAWPGADVLLRSRALNWAGADCGTGRLRSRELEIIATGRRLGGVPRRQVLALDGTGLHIRQAVSTVAVQPVADTG